MDNKKRYILGVVVAVIGLICFVLFAKDEEIGNYEDSASETTTSSLVDDTSEIENIVMDDASATTTSGLSDGAENVTEENVTEENESITENSQESTKDYSFRNQKLLNQHYDKHGKEMGFASASDYEAAASAVVNNPSALHKIEAEDGDDVYYVEATNEFVIVSTDGYIRTYFLPSGGIDYYNRQ